MLATRLPFIPYEILQTGDQTSEAFALCYLASYNDQAIQPRVSTAFANSYGVDRIVRKQFVPNGRPGYVVTFYDNPDRPRVTVAIEGMRQLNQLSTTWSSSAPQTNARIPGGKVYQTFEAYAETIKTELLADGQFAPAWSALGVPLTITGFSLGAAVAEVLAEKFRMVNNVKAIKVVKFASPRVGNTPYLLARSRTILRKSVYLDRDPIDLIPYACCGSNVFSSGGGRIWFNYDRDPTADRYTRDGVPHPQPFHEGGQNQALAMVRRATLTPNNSNPWYDHLMMNYRLLMFAWFRREPDGLPFRRFATLEFNDENQWYQQWRPGTYVTDFMQTIVSPQPDPISFVWDRFDLAAAESRIDFRERDTDTAIGGGASGTWDPSPDLTTQDLSGREPVQPTVRDTVRVQPTVYDPNAQGRRRRF